MIPGGTESFTFRDVHLLVSECGSHACVYVRYCKEGTQIYCMFFFRESIPSARPLRKLVLDPLQLALDRRALRGGLHPIDDRRRVGRRRRCHRRRRLRILSDRRLGRRDRRRLVDARHGPLLALATTATVAPGRRGRGRGRSRVPTKPVGSAGILQLPTKPAGSAAAADVAAAATAAAAAAAAAAA